MTERLSARSNASGRRNIRASWRARVTLMICSTLMTLAAVELALRVHFAIAPHARLAAPRREPAFTDPQREVRLGDLVRPSQHPRVVYELIPDVTTRFKGKSLRINQRGFRGPAHPHDKPENTIRILGIGDSVMFGWGVEENESYLALLADRLHRRYPHVCWQVINTAVPGYNTSMEAGVLRSYGLAYDPDLVIVGYVPNDLDLPNFLLQPRKAWTLSESFLAEFLSRGLQPDRLVAGKKGRHRVVFDSELDADRVPKRYRYMVGEEGFRAAMSEMNELKKENDFELLVFSYVGATPHHQRIKRILSQLGTPYLSADTETRTYMKRRGIQKWPGSELVISDQDPHPSALWHDLLANVLLDHLEKRGVISDRIAALNSRRDPLRQARSPNSPSEN